MTVETGDYHFDISYYDFSKSHDDFSASIMPAYSQPTYVASPYGAWLSNSDTPTSDTFSDWFRDRPGINHLIRGELVLKYNAIMQVNRFVTAISIRSDMYKQEDLYFLLA